MQYGNPYFAQPFQQIQPYQDRFELQSYGLLPELHRMVKKRYWVDAEEFVCNILADYGQFVIGTARDILGNQFTYVAPIGAERMIA